MPKIKRKREVIAGLDEVGLGALAGPLFIVVAGFTEEDSPVEGVDDSKKISKRKREKLAPLIVNAAAYIGVGWAYPKDIDRFGVAAAWQLAASLALSRAPIIKHMFVDGRRAVMDTGVRQSTHDKGESKYWQIAAASVVAKVLRDREMEWLSEQYPEYSCWAKDAGYGTDRHRDALLEHGPTPAHRMLFLRNMIEEYELDWA